MKHAIDPGKRQLPCYSLRYYGHQGKVTGVKFGTATGPILSAGEDGTLRVWDMNTGAELHCWSAHQGQVRCVAVSPDGQSILSGGEDGSICLWQFPT